MDDLTFAARRATRDRRSESDVDAVSATLVQSPLRAGILRFVSARPGESFDIETLMQTFGRMRLDIENCVRELVDFGVVRKMRARHRCSRRCGPTAPAGSPARRVPRAPRPHRRRGNVPLGPALPRDDRPRREDAGHLRVDSDRRQVRHLGPDPGPDRRRQGSRGPDDSRAVAAQPGTLPGRQLRGAARHAVRIRDLRLREGRLHRRARSQARTPRNGQRRHAVPRRGRRPVAGGAGQAVTRARRAPLRTARRQPLHLRSTSA